MCVLLFALSELGREVVLLPLVPVSLVTMLVRTSLKPVDSLLNGVALTFVLAVDDLLVSVALSYRAKGKFVADILPITLVHPVPIEMNKRRPDVRGALILLNICTCFYLINGVYCDGMVALCMITSWGSTAHTGRPCLCTHHCIRAASRDFSH